MPFLSFLSGGAAKVWAGIVAVGAFLVALAVAVSKIKQAGRNEVTTAVNQSTGEAAARMAEAAAQAPKDTQPVASDMRKGKFCFALLACLLMAACQPQVAVKTVCPPLIDYDPAFLNSAADELDRLPAGSPVARLVIDYRQLRDMVRACKGE
jgi:hypothetical protein